MTPETVVITGATSGIGAALVKVYARPGVRLLLMGRDVERMAAVKKEAESRGALITCATNDVRDLDGTRLTLEGFAADNPIDLLILSAGVKIPNIGGIEAAADLDRVIDVNFRATLHAVQAVLPAMKARGRGQIALVSSAAALAPTADLLSYSATKSALRAYATALRREVMGTGVHVSVITPGFVNTPMTDRQVGPTPFRLSADKAAALMQRGLERRKAHISFPLALIFLIRLGNLLPTALADKVFAQFRARILPDADTQAIDQD